MSESDYPFEIIRWDGQIGAITAEYLRHVSGVPAEAPIEETNVDNFLQMSGQFRGLAALLKKSLRDLKVYKIGTISIPVYIVGQSDEGNWLGLSTRLIQT